MLNTIAVAAGKGGVLKTTLACHLVAAAAESGDRVLLVDCDPQGNAALDLGYRGDGGLALADALTTGAQPSPILGVRPGLDVLAGGRELDAAALHLARTGADGTALRRSFGLLDRYDLIVIDCPARELVIRRCALTAAGFVVVPSTADLASYHGLADLAGSITDVRSSNNPDLDVLAVVAGPIPASGSAIRARAIEELGRYIGDPDLVCSSTIRSSLRTALECRATGRVSWAVESPDGPGRHLAEDWRRVTADLLERHRAAVHERSTWA